MTNNYTFIDLFSGCGGLSLGFEQAGFKGILAIDNWQDALDTYTHNRPKAKTLCGDLSKLEPKLLKEEYHIDNVDVIIGGPPCQGFSVAGKRIIDDIRNTLYKSFVRFVEVFQPKAFVMENVPNILTIGDGIVRQSILNDFQDLGYTVEFKVMMASDYGVPQNRRRAVFVGFKDGTHFSFPEKIVSTPVTSLDALSDLTEDSIAEGAKYPNPISSDFQQYARANCSKVYNHEVTKHNEQTTEIISMVPDGGNYKDLPKNLQSTRKVHIAWTRLNSKKPSFTIDCGHRHHFHYKYNRVPTVRECARIQSFPDDFVFCKSRTSQYKQVGNAVPPLMAKAIAEELKKQFNHGKTK